jgi:Flp pilus assembly protein TadG
MKKPAEAHVVTSCQDKQPGLQTIIDRIGRNRLPHQDSSHPCNYACLQGFHRWSIRIIDSLHSREEGSVVILVAMTLLTLIAVAGLAMDGGQLYAAKQQLQAAADAAAMAGVMDMYNGTTSSGSYGTHVSPCAATSSWTPCYYARNNGLTSDSICVDFPAAQPSSWPPAKCGTSDDTSSHCAPKAASGPCNIRVTVARTVNTTLLRVVGQNSSTVSATAVAAITNGPAALPIVVTHPTLKDALATQGNTFITITGGPARTIQVNSTGTSAGGTAEAFTVGGSSYIDLSAAGPSGNGGEFRSWGPKDPAVSTLNNTGACSNKSICLGTAGSYAQPASIIEDPFASLAQPSVPASAGTFTDVSAGKSVSGITGCSMGGVATQFSCPANAVGGSCRIYRPGSYASGIQVKSTTGYFYPGLYYITTADSGNNATGFQAASNSDMEMLSSVTGCGGVASSGSADFSNGGMVVFNGGAGIFDVGSNGQANLLGPNNGTGTNYEGILFWEDRTLTPNAMTHKFGGGGAMQLTGTIYINMQPSSVTDTKYHLVQVSGNSSSNTKILGEIISNAILLKGGGTIQMVLNSTLVPQVRQVALVQ